MLPETQYAVQLVGPGELTLNTAKEVFRPGPHQVVGKVEAVGLCFSDLKLLKQFGEHPRKGEVQSGMAADDLASIPNYVPGDKPTVPGHEVVLTVVETGEGVTRYKPGDRFIVQADYRALPTHGSNSAFGYNFEGALQEYVLLDERIMADEDGSHRYLIPVGADLSAAAVALVEPWACVECSYATPERRAIKAGGRLLVVASPGARVEGLEGALSPDGRPGSVTFIGSGSQRSALDGLDIPIETADDAAGLPDEAFDDILYFGDDASAVEALNDKIAVGGILALVQNGGKFGRPVSVGVGRIHYGPTRWVGTTGDNAADAYAVIPENGEIRPNDRVLIIGAGGPMGQMHVIRAVTAGIPGLTVTAADRDDARLHALNHKVNPQAAAHGVLYHSINTATEPQPPSFTYYAIMAPVAAIVEDAIENAAPDAIINIFAGIPAPVKHPLNLDALIEKRLFVFGTSGSETEHMRIVLDKVTLGRLDTSASVDAVCGMAGAKDGLAAVENRTLAGKILVYPSLHDLPLIPLSRMADKYPTVAEKIEDGRWTPEAEAELLKVANG